MKKTLQYWLGHEAGSMVQFIKYGVAGGVATVTHIMVFFLMGWRLFPCLTEDDIMIRLLGAAPPAALDEGRRALNAALSNGLAFVFSNAVAYALNVWFVFKGGRHKFWIAIALFYAVSGTSMLLGTGLQSLLIARYGIMTTPAFGANILTALLINYAMRKYVIFHG